jgi:hypothetical protein
MTSDAQTRLYRGRVKSYIAAVSLYLLAVAATAEPLAGLISSRVTTSVTGKLAWICVYRLGNQTFQVTLDHQYPPTMEVQ